MKKVLVAIKDNKVGFLNCSCFDSLEAAQRDFLSLFKPGSSKCADFPEDYDLYSVGSFDSNSGFISSDYETSDGLAFTPVCIFRGMNAFEYWKNPTEVDKNA